MITRSRLEQHFDLASGQSLFHYYVRVIRILSIATVQGLCILLESLYLVYRNIFGEVIPVLRRSSPPVLFIPQVLDRTCPLHELCLFPGCLVQRQADRHAILIQPNGYDDHWVAGLCCVLLADPATITHQEGIQLAGLAARVRVFESCVYAHFASLFVNMF